MNNDCAVAERYKKRTGLLVNVTYALQGKKVSKNGEEFVYNTIRGLGIQELKK